MAGGSGVTERKGTGGSQATAEVTVEHAPEGPVSLKRTVGQRAWAMLVANYRLLHWL